MAKWLSCRAPLQQPRVSLVRILGVDMAPLIQPCWGGIPHATTRERPTTKKKKYIYTTMYWGDLEKKKQEKKRLATVVSPGSNL